MSYRLTNSLLLGEDIDVDTLRAQLIDADGFSVGLEVSSGFVDAGGGAFLWTYDFPTGFSGGIRIYTASDPTNLLTLIPLNPNDNENLDVKVSSLRSSDGSNPFVATPGYSPISLPVACGGEIFDLPELVGLLVHSCDIHTETHNKSTYGGSNATWGPKAEAVPCRLEKLKPDVAGMLYPKFDSTKLYRVYFNTDQSLTVNDRLRINGAWYQVQSVMNVDELGLLWQVDVERKPVGSGA